MIRDNLSISDPIGTYLDIPQDVYSVVFSHLEPAGIESALLVNKLWRKTIVENPYFRTRMIGPNDWAKFFKGPALSDEEIQIIYASLPNNLYKILNTPCPVFSKEGEVVKKYGGLIKNTHVLAYISRYVRSGTHTLTAITLRSLGALLESKLDPYDLIGKKREIEGYDELCEELDIDIIVKEAHWVLLAKDLLGETDYGPTGSRGKSYDAHVKMIEELRKKTGQFYQMPSRLEFVAVIVAHWIKFNECLFGPADDYKETYTSVEDDERAYGNTEKYGMRITYEASEDDTGIAPAMRFYPEKGSKK